MADDFHLPHTWQGWGWLALAVIAVTIGVNTVVNHLPASVSNPYQTAIKGF